MEEYLGMIVLWLCQRGMALLSTIRFWRIGVAPPASNAIYSYISDQEMQETDQKMSREATGYSTKKAKIKRDRSGGNRLSNSIYAEVRNRICQLIYPPEYRIREADLASEFEISKTPIRQVLQRLEIEGYVETHNGVGTIVTKIDLPSFRDVYDMRLKFAELVGEMSPGTVTDRHIREMEDLHKQAEQLPKQIDRQAFWQINIDRHDIILSLIGNTALCELYDAYYFRTSRVWYLVIDQIWDGQVEALCSELDDLSRALRSGDMRAVANVERNHLSYYLVMFSDFVGDGDNQTLNRP